MPCTPAHAASWQGQPLRVDMASQSPRGSTARPRITASANMCVGHLRRLVAAASGLQPQNLRMFYQGGASHGAGLPHWLKDCVLVGDHVCHL